MSERMTARQCRRCRKLYIPVGLNPNCPECVRRIDEAFVRVRDYLYSHPSASMDELIELGDVTPADVDGWLREGRLLVSKDTKLIVCVRCGKPISSGKLCGDCAGTIGSMYAPDREQIQSANRDGRMHIENLKNKKNS